MILKRLYELADREGLLQDPAFDTAPVAAMITIGEHGEFLGKIMDLRTRQEIPPKKKDAKPKLVVDKGKPLSIPVRPVVLDKPKLPKKKSEKTAESSQSRWKVTDPASSGKEKPAVFLADTIARVLPVHRLIAAKDRDKFDAQRSTFWRFVDHVAAETGDPALSALQRFGQWLQNDESAGELLASEVEANDLNIAHRCTFSWLPDENTGKPILDRPAIRKWWRDFFAADREEQQSKVFRARCQVTEAESAIPSSIKTRINGLVSIGCRADAYLVTAVDASESYGLSGAATGMISAEGVDGFTRALNALIGNELSGCPKTSLRVGTSMFLIWTRNKQPFSFLALENGDPEEVVRLIDAANAGRLQYGAAVRDFYCLTISGNSSRVVVRDYLEAPLPEVEYNLGCWFRDLSIVDPFNAETTSAFPLWVLANSTVRTGDALPPDLPTLLMSGALKGTPLPMQVLAACLRRLRVESGTSQFRPERMALIKLILNRFSSKGGMPMTAKLDLERKTDPAYVCGRLFACLAYIQAFERNPKKHGFGQEAAMLSGYYGAASAAPRSVFGTLLRQTQHRLNKLKDEYGSFVTNRSKELEEFAQHLGSASTWQAEFPPVLSLAEQGRFALGYYHQRAQYRAASLERRTAGASA